MAGLVRPRMYPIREVTSDKQDSGLIYNPHRMAHHGGLDAPSKYPKGDGGSLMDVKPPTNVNPAQESRRSSDD